VFPDHAFMQGTIRCYNQEVFLKIRNKIKHIAETTAEAFNCRAEVDFNEMYPPVINHEKET